MADRDTDELNIDNVIKKLLKGKDKNITLKYSLCVKNIYFNNKIIMIPVNSK